MLHTAYTRIECCAVQAQHTQICFLQVRFVVNPQTTELLNTLNIRDHIAEKFGPKANGKPAKKVGDGCNPDEIDLGDL